MKSGGSLFANSLLVLLDSVWKSERVHQERVNAHLLPVPKKKDLYLNNDCSGIALLDLVHVRKVVSKVIQALRKLVVEDVLLELQCRFHALAVAVMI